ncbi:MAG: hypothetical protein JNK87_06245, partial [Bryobacterales bacterium]|nr:hypothetical protein [Bryobacterales bacterium]
MRWTLPILVLHSVGLNAAFALHRNIHETLQSAAAAPDSEIYFAAAVAVGIFA